MSIENDENSQPNEFHVMMALECQLLRVLRELKGISICTLAKNMNCSRNRLAKMERNDVADGHDTKEDYLTTLDVKTRYFSAVMTYTIINYEDHGMEMLKNEKVLRLAYNQAKSVSAPLKHLCRDIVNTTMMLASLVAIGQQLKLKTHLLVDTVIVPKGKMANSQKEKKYLEFQESVLNCDATENILSEKETEEIWQTACKYMGLLNRQHKRLEKLLTKEGMKNE